MNTNILRSFCAEGAIRPALTEPFIIWDWVYATDSFTMCRILKDNFLAEELEQIQKDRKNLWIKEKLFPGNASEYYERKENEIMKCDTIMNTEINYELLEWQEEEIGQVDCEECEGTGTKTCWHCDSEIECKDCKGYGYIRKWTGQMITIFKKRVLIHGTYINGNYFKRALDSFPKNTPVNIEVVVWELKPVKFFNSEIEIIIMPLSFLEDWNQWIPFQEMCNKS